MGPAVALLVATVGSAPAPALAACDVIPGASSTIQSNRGAVDRPFAGPGAVMSLSQGCNGAPISGAASDFLVTFVFTGSAQTPVAADQRRIVILSTAQPDDVPACAGAAESPCWVAAGERGIVPRAGNVLDVTMPSTDGHVGDGDDGQTLAGPVSIVVTSAAKKPPRISTKGTPCETIRDPLLCIERLFEDSSPCPGPLLAARKPAVSTGFDQFVALPVANSFAALCTGSGCQGSADTIRLAVGAGGDLLIPVDWSGVLASNNKAIARIVRGESNVGAFFDGGPPIALPSNAFVASFGLNGLRLAPLFDPKVSPEGAESGAVTLFGTVDAPTTVLRITRARGECASGVACVVDLDCTDGSRCKKTCELGSTPGARECKSDKDCLTDEHCGHWLFDFPAGRTIDGLGMVAITKASQGASALATAASGARIPATLTATVTEKVPLVGLLQSQETTAFVRSETQDSPPVDLNGDGDENDAAILKLHDRSTHEVGRIGDAGKEGRAVVQLSQRSATQPLARSSSLVANGALVAFLESEPNQAGSTFGSADRNGNGRVVDSVLQIYRRSVAAGAFQGFAPVVYPTTPAG